LLILFAAPGLAQQAGSPATIESLLSSLRQSGIDVIYSSELVTPDLLCPPAGLETSRLRQARAALGAHGLALRQLGPTTYVVIRDTPPEAPAETAEPALEEISVFASRYSLDANLADPRGLGISDIERVPGSHDDAMRSLTSLPGVVSGASARPYIRGSLSEDVLVRYDGIPLIDPFHLKNFQSLLSAIDPAAVERIDVFSGGFPVRYGTRSGGVIDITAPSTVSGREYRANASFISAGASARGRAESRPVEWLAAIRRSTLDLLDPVEDNVGTPQFVDSLGRVRWSTESGAWTAGWLLLDDRLDLGGDDEEERATAVYRDEYLWLARDHRFADALTMRTSLVLTSAERTREGELLRPGVVTGSLTETRGFDGVELSSDWHYAAGGNSSYSFGGGFAATRARYAYQRSSAFSPEVAAAFGRQPLEDLQFAASPEVVTYALYASNRRKWSRFEAELGIRADAQHYQGDGSHTQISPRLNLRYDVNDEWRAYASIGRFTQAQHVEEWRVEEAQQIPDASQASIHSILGVEYDVDSGTRISLEAYTKRWTTASAYFDSQLDPFTLLPDLMPDRIRIKPSASEASGFELSARRPLSERWLTWGTLTWARVADDFLDSQDVLRSWDQPVSLSAGLAWKDSRASVSVLAGWHSGWPRTPVSFTPLSLGERNTGRWPDYFSLDLRGSWDWYWASGNLSLVLDLTNITNRKNPCCANLAQSVGQGLGLETDGWLPALVNLGVTYRWGD
jgi:outer membrane receptor protein involved in Fe transport